MTLKDKIMQYLSEYDSIEKYLGNIVRQRLEIEGYTRGMLTASLLDGESSKSDLKRLEGALQLGKVLCADFQSIFQERKLPNKDIAIDVEIINILAEVKAFEILHEHSFRAITKIKRKKDAKTVDFIAKKDMQDYAIEVTRLGLAQADRKKPVYMVRDKLPAHNIPGIRNLVGEFVILSGKDNMPRIRETINDAIESKYRQIKEFCQNQHSLTKGILFISSGRDYFVANRYARNEFELSPKAVKEALKHEWESIKQHNTYENLHHIIVTICKDLKKAIIYPSFEI